VLLPISLVKVRTDRNFDVPFECPHCSYTGWARARGQATGLDAGPFSTASARTAYEHSDLMAKQAAMYDVRGCPCPKCGKHDPEVARFAANIRWENAKRKRWRPFALVLAILGGVGTPVALVVGIVGRFETLGVWGTMGAATISALGVSLWFAWRPLIGFVIHDTVPDGVEFLKDDPYRRSS
jgi:predicted RNA-binding Zn-ribbon protein involved in translation (DUF1610 family)